MKEDPRGRELPDHFVQAEAFYQALRKDPEWLKANNGKYLAIMGQEVVGQADSFQELSLKVREVHGYGPIFMPYVTIEPIVTKLRPRIVMNPPQGR